jgi:thymidylate synthase ThyX
VCLPGAFKDAMNKAQKNFEIMQSLAEVNGVNPSNAAYILPLGMKRGFLMKMDAAEVDYIAELRTKPAGHIAYRRVAWEMFKALKRKAPTLAAGIESRVCDPDAPIDLYDRKKNLCGSLHFRTVARQELEYERA